MSKKVLLVDDEVMVLELAKKKLQNSGYDIITAANGQEALHILENNSPDCIVLDIQMPVMNGYTFLLELEKRHIYHKIPILVLTAYDAMEPIFKRHNIKGYILKPLKLEELVEKVKDILGAPV